MLVCVAGTDGSGKSTLVKGLADDLKKEYKCTNLRIYETNLDPKLQKRAALHLKRTGIKLTHYNLAIAYLILELKEKTYPKLLEEIGKNEIVILDRYYETIEFMIHNYNVDPRLNCFKFEEYIKPDISLFIDIAPETCYERICKLRTPGDGEELDEIQSAYKFYTENKTKYDFRLVNGNESIENLRNICKKEILNQFSSVK